MSSAAIASNPSARLRALCAQFARPHFGRALWQLTNTLLPFIVLWALMAWMHVADLGYGWTLLLALPLAGLYVLLQARF